MLRKFFARFLVTIFVSLAVSFSFLFAIYLTLFNKDFYENEVSGLVQTFFVSEITEEFEYEEFSLSKDEFESVLRKTFSKEDLSQAINGLYEDFSRDFRDGEIDLSLEWLRDKNADLSNNLSAAIFSEVKKCAVGESVNFDEGIKCLPTHYDEKDLALRLQTELDIAFFSKIPSNAQLNIQASPELRNNLNDNFQLFRDFIWIFPAVLIFLLVLIFVLIGKPFVSAFKWVFTSVLIAAVLTGLSLLCLNLVFKEILTRLITDSYSGAIYIKYFIDLLNLFFASLNENVLAYLLPIGIFSFIVLILLTIKNEPQ